MTDSTEFMRNIRNHSLEASRRYAGRNIAWSGDGTQVLASAEDLSDLFAELDRRGISDYVIDFSPTLVDPVSAASADNGEHK